MRRFPALVHAAAVAGISVPASSWALVTEPNGVVVPLDSMNGETQLYTLFQTRGEPIDWRNDAVDVPETFSPLCDFTAEFVSKQSGSSVPLGWYNVVPGATAPPPVSQIYEIVSCNTPVGTVITSQQIKTDPRYASAEIGFALANGDGCVTFNNPATIYQIHFTEKKFNVKFANNPAAPWVMALVYDSKLVQNAFFIAWEDWHVSPAGWQNDGDFNDYVFLMSGLVCTGGGAPCETGQPGECGPGVMQCRNGQLVCEGLVAPGAPEKCDGLDNDCNGKLDDGDLCEAGEVCDNGVCVGKCSSSEFACQGLEQCNSKGYCVDPDCLDVACGEGEICVDGKCRAACEGVTCPHGQACRLGACVDPCSSVTCGDREVCAEGVCRPVCACAPCPPGLDCHDQTGLCVEAGCGSVTCPAGEHCKAGQCEDSCAGASCPRGEICRSGSCVSLPEGGADGGAGGGGSIFGSGGSGASGPPAAIFTDAGDSDGSTDAGPGGLPRRRHDVPASSGCGCRVAGAGSGAPGSWTAAALAAAALLARRRPSARAPRARQRSTLVNGRPPS